MDTIGMDVLKRRYRNLKPDGHWFDRDTMRFFRSRLPSQAYQQDNGNLVFFVTSEQFIGSDRVPSPRGYTVRVMDWLTGEIGTEGKFNALTRYAAQREAKRLAESA